ncbi:hypothetical protein AB9N12_17675 [Bacteroides sp. AN502(2024)]|uniref:hypothetical protein n=1 Tax=Bacteroides sp. AN502(2024) TaxID=3160599 RepID=UPI0035194D4D
MAIRLRSTLKQWFKRGKYPIEEQFADWIDSFLHKTEDKLPLANVEDLPEQLNAKYDHSSGVALEKRHSMLRTEFDQHTAVAEKEFRRVSDDMDDLQATDIRQQAEIDTANADAESLRGCLHPTDPCASLESTFSALGANYSTLWALANTIKTFLEAKDTADSTINRWREMEAFLQGVTDAETLTGMLEELRKTIATACHEEISDETKRATDAEEGLRKTLENLRDSLADRSYTLDFGQTGVAIQDVNMEAYAVTMKEVRLFNVAHLWITAGNTIRREVDPENPQAILIEPGQLATWEIQRVNEAAAAVGIRCVMSRPHRRASDV